MSQLTLQQNDSQPRSPSPSLPYRSGDPDRAKGGSPGPPPRAHPGIAPTCRGKGRDRARVEVTRTWSPPTLQPALLRGRLGWLPRASVPPRCTHRSWLGCRTGLKDTGRSVPTGRERLQIPPRAEAPLAGEITDGFSFCFTFPRGGATGAIGATRADCGFAANAAGCLRVRDTSQLRPCGSEAGLL